MKHGDVDGDLARGGKVGEVGGEEGCEEGCGDSLGEGGSRWGGSEARSVRRETKSPFEATGKVAGMAVGGDSVDSVE